jgi:hypothetical protein
LKTFCDRNIALVGGKSFKFYELHNTTGVSTSLSAGFNIPSAGKFAPTGGSHNQSAGSLNQSAVSFNQTAIFHNPSAN